MRDRRLMWFLQAGLWSRTDDLPLITFGRHPGILLELPAEMLDVLIPAPGCDLCNSLVAVCQIFLRESDAMGDDVIHTGYAERLLVDRLQIAGADS